MVGLVDLEKIMAGAVGGGLLVTDEMEYSLQGSCIFPGMQWRGC